MNVVSGLDEAAVEGLVRSQATFEVIGLRDPLKKPIFWRGTGLERLYLLASIFEEKAFSDLT
ncbi:hypothetical protein [Pseudomonas tremae]|uniref:hypothetical protein n=1 Tax=Pseudomonas tremae TaxID=200454 RepID=UPI0011836CD9|nr:hypothetical protein [Pseudomonas tremae]